MFSLWQKCFPLEWKCPKNWLEKSFILLPIWQCLELSYTVEFEFFWKCGLSGILCTLHTQDIAFTTIKLCSMSRIRIYWIVNWECWKSFESTPSNNHTTSMNRFHNFILVSKSLRKLSLVRRRSFIIFCYLQFFSINDIWGMSIALPKIVILMINFTYTYFYRQRIRARNLATPFLGTILYGLRWRHGNLRSRTLFS